MPVTLRDFYEDHYRLELARHQELTGALSLPLGVLTLLVGGLLLLTKELDSPLGYSGIVQLVFVALGAVFLLSSAYFLIRS